MKYARRFCELRKRNALGKALALSVIFLFCSLSAWSQMVTHGPVVGAVTWESARVLVRTDAQATVRFELDTDDSFTNPISTESQVADSQLDYFVIVDVENLLPDTQYYCRAVIDGTPQQESSRFMTFPPPGTTSVFTFAFGACQQADGDVNSNIGRVFPLIVQDKPRFFLQLGDWSYPDVKHAAAGLSGMFNEDFSRVQESYRTKYDPTYPMRELFEVAPIDYVYDDHDYSANDRDMTAPARENSLRGYEIMFPHYPLANASNGLWHKFTFGNADFFVLDTRTQRHPNSLAFQKAENGDLIFQPGTEHLVLQGDPDISGELQMDWLIRELQASTATWKFICSSIAFNPGHRAVVELALHLRNTDENNSAGLLTTVANGLSDGWSGFPASVQRLVSAVSESNIQNVIMLSGDSHTAAVDDGAHSLFPEFMAGGLDRSNSHVVALMELFNIHPWNQGGQTLERNNFNSHYGRVTVSGDDSVTFDIVDEFGELITSYTQQAGHLVSPVGLAIAPEKLAYGEVPVGTAISEKLLLVNTGADPVEVYHIVSSSPSFRLPSHIQIPFTIPPGARMDLDILFQPGMPDRQTAALTIDSNDPESPFIVPLEGIGLEPIFSFTTSLTPGLNMISIPLKPEEPYTARSLAEKLSATIIIEFDAIQQRFMGFTNIASGDGFPIQGDKGYIINVPDGGNFIFNGTAWTNAPPIRKHSAWAFVVNGFLMGDRAIDFEDYAVTVRNLSTGAAITETIDADGYFSAAWADLSRNSVVENGHAIEIAVVDRRGKMVSGPYVHQVTPDSIRNALMNVGLRLGHVIPEESVLLQNYPNPFNPETWIPYQLAEASEATLWIYSSTGQLIRTLDIGYRDAGSYITKDNAIHWDGSTDAGERVASGVYFYKIQAGEYRATRKMTVNQ